ncbi:MAG: dTMP kinase [Balneolaceae bacterium]
MKKSLNREGGVLVTFEGIDGSGKSTQIRLLTEWLRDRKIPFHLFREPGGTELSEQIRELLLHSSGPMDPVTELLLFSAARSQLVAERLIPLLKRGDLIILDRFFDSTIAYQGYGRESASPDEIHRLNHLVSHRLRPDLTIYLRISPALARSRRAEEADDRMEREEDSFFERVALGFERLAEQSDRIVSLNGERPVEEIHRDVVRLMRSLTD